METAEKLRTVKREGPDGSLTTVDFLELKKGDKFRLYEPEGTDPSLSIENGETLYLAVEDAYPINPGYAGVKTEPFTDHVGDHSVVWDISKP
jgi:hypothetical protein